MGEIHDFDFMGVNLSELGDIGALCELVGALAEHGEPLAVSSRILAPVTLATSKKPSAASMSQSLITPMRWPPSAWKSRNTTPWWSARRRLGSFSGSHGP